MKNMILIAIILLPMTIMASDKYLKSMTSNIEALYDANSIEDLQSVANKFDRVASAEPEEWLPRYYAALANTWMATREEDLSKKDEYLDVAQVKMDEAASIEGENVEIVALQGFIQMIGISVDPATRGATYSQKAFAAFMKATQMDAKNPRALFFKGQMEYGTAQFFKGDTSAACDTMAKSIELFDNFTPVSALHPNWGKGFAQRTVENCKSE